MKPTQKRYIVTIFYFIVAALVINFYYNSSLYSNSYPYRYGYSFLSVINMLLAIVVIVALKYFIYDSVSQKVLKKRPTLLAKTMFYTGFFAVLLLDTLILFSALQPLGSVSGLAGVAFILFSPPALLLSFLLVLGASFIPFRK